MTAFDFHHDNGKLKSMAGVGGEAVVGVAFCLNGRTQQYSRAGPCPLLSLTLTVIG